MDSKADLGKQKKNYRQTEQGKLSSLRKRKKTDRKINTVRYLQDTNQCTNISTVGVPGGGKEQNEGDRVSGKLTTENFPKSDET